MRTFKISKIAEPEDENFMKTQLVSRTYPELKAIGLGVLLLAACSQLSIPLEPVPVTMQTVAVMLLGLLYAPSLAVKTMLAYLAVGALGVPVFANFAAGTAVLFGKTAGYLWGFVAAVWLMAHLKQWGFPAAQWLNELFLCLLGTAVIFVFGVSYLASFIGFDAAMQYGFWPFLLPGLAKAILLVAVRRALL